MKISNHILIPEGTEKIITNKRSPNQKELTTADRLPKDLIIHYTACGLTPTLNTFMAKNSTSAHLVIDRDGTIHQLVPFNKQAFHAGYSVWDQNSGFNGRSIGIELINMGWDVAKLPTSEVATLAHKHKFVTEKKWHKYTKEQLAALYSVTKVLLNTYNLQRILGHEDISAGRKQDPGPAFPWDEYRKDIFGNSNNIGKVFKTKVADVNLRKGDGASFAIVKTLAKGYEVGIIETWNNWSKVYLVNSAADVVKMEKGTQINIKTMGWIRSDLLESK